MKVDSSLLFRFVERGMAARSTWSFVKDQSGFGVSIESIIFVILNLEIN